MSESGRVRVAVVFGGRSGEHAVSCLSAASVMRHLDPRRYDVVPVGISRAGRWVLQSGDPARLAVSDGALPEVTGGAGVVLPPDPTAGGLVVIEPGEATRLLSGVDVVFPVLHGAYGEDGTIQGLLEMAGIPYVGAGVLGSAVAMDKEYAKKLLAAAGLPVGDYEVLRAGTCLSDDARARLGLPVFVKPARAGSSVGISRVTDWTGLESAVALARETDDKVIVEAAITGREVECGVIDDVDGGPPIASLPAEIRLVRGHDWYDFDAKYLDDACEFDIPARLPEADIEQIRSMAVRAFTALDGAGLARIDFFVTDAGPVLNEVNTMPGFTDISMFPRAWQASGIEIGELLDRLLGVALRRPRRHG
ncbi:MAG: D-alanine--D-alanine ligase A [Pseudonocardiales bacterium]|nr:MAG: D-alanine--D-alanine ligase A [Pseudonocardiales bacterium]